MFLSIFLVHFHVYLPVHPVTLYVYTSFAVSFLAFFAFADFFPFLDPAPQPK